MGITAYVLVVFDKACELGLEGIVSKRAGSFYKSGPSRSFGRDPGRGRFLRGLARCFGYNLRRKCR
jgi:hypothetical protein